MNIVQILQASQLVAGIIGGNFSQAVPAITFVLHVVAQVESMKGLSGPQKLEAARQLVHEGLDSVPALARLAKDPARLERLIDQAVAIANLFVK